MQLCKSRESQKVKDYMKLFGFSTQKKGDTSVVRLTLLYVITITLTESSNNGNHLAFGIGIIPCEISLQLSIWET